MTTPFAVFDLETDPFLFDRFPRPFAAGFFDGKTYVKFWGKNCVADLARVISSFPGIVFAHNGGKFDTHYLIDFVDWSKPVKFLKINGRIAKLPFGAAEIRDSWLILPVALAKLEKLKIDYSKFEAEKREEFKTEIEHYLEIDCRSLWDKIHRFFSEYGRGLTLANRAFSQLGKLVQTPARTSLAYDERFREFYFGGRVQAIRPGIHSGNFVYLDINSAYPFAMLHPHWWGADFLTLDELPKFGVEQCLIEFRGFSKGALPKRSEKTGELIFPNEKGDWKCTGWEFVAGIETGRISVDKIKAVHRPWETKAFTSYVDHFWKLKDEATKAGDKVRREFAKLFLNSAYGKFALNPRHFTENCLMPFGVEPKADPENPWELHSTNLERGFCEYQRPQKLKNSPCYNVATAASITGFVRSYLLRALSVVENPFYCDTDSIMASASGGLPVGNEIGQWKIEAMGDFFAVGGKKLYAFRTDEISNENDRDVFQGRKWKTACKGARPTVPEIIKAVSGESVTWKNDAPSFKLGTPSTWKRKKAGTLFVERTITKTAKERIEF